LQFTLLSRVAVAFLLVTLAGMLGSGCRRQGCVGGNDGRCLPAPACEALRYDCPVGGGDALRVVRLTTSTDRSAGPKALAAAGDFLLENDRIRAVLDAPEHPQGLAPSGGSIIDLAPRGQTEQSADQPGGDQLNGIFQAAGVLPRDAVHYQSAEVLDQHLGASPGIPPFVAVIFRGHLAGDPRVTVVTRYELRACEPGLRVRSDLFNGARDPNTLYLGDGFFWGDRTLLPFVPIKGHGFLFPELDLLELSRAWRTWPFLAARPQGSPHVSYAVVGCDGDRLEGFNEPTLSAAGLPLRPTLPGDGMSYQRFILAAAGPGLAPAVGEALRVRSLVHREAAPVTVRGRILSRGVPLDGRQGRAATLLFYQPGGGPDPDAAAERTPWSEAVPGPDGQFAVDLPPNRAYRIQPYAFGRAIGAPASVVIASDQSEVDVGDITVEAPARLRINVEGDPGEPAAYAEVVLIPFARPASAALPPSLYGVFGGCVPMLGPPHGGSPACNRALVADGRVDLLVPPGHYFVYATRGPFASLDRQEITLAEGQEQELTLSTRPIPDLVPPGVVSGDFHVHGGASYDSAIPDQDRVVSFLANGVDVIVATDHDVVTTYESTLAALDATGQIVIIPGVEATPNILWFEVPGEKFPKTVGHFNFWPLTHDPLAARNGAPWDELFEPGALMDAMEPLYRGGAGGTVGVRQLNHPWGGTKLGRDEGFLRMLGYDPRTPIVAGASFAADVLLRRPGAKHRNLDWDVQEVMTGASRRDWLRYRTLWFSLLSQNILRAGVANSDTHTLAIERVGYPRNLVFGGAEGHDRANLDLDRFDADVRAGHVVGTNGPVLEAVINDSVGTPRSPGLSPFAPTVSRVLTVALAAAPWIPVSELRVFVNGNLVKTLDVSSAFTGRDRYGVEPGRTRVTIPLGDALPPRGDAWVVVEAGLQQELPPDNDGPADGLPDLPDDQIPMRPRTVEDSRFDLEAVAPGIWPTAFTNPFLLDLDGGGWAAPGLP
jgi:hypothetical protein